MLRINFTVKALPKPILTPRLTVLFITGEPPPEDKGKAEASLLAPARYNRELDINTIT